MQALLDISDVRGYFASHREEIVADLFSLCRIPSVRAPQKDGKPFGEACDLALTEALRLFEKAGFSGEVSADRSYALAYFGERKLEGSVCLFAHTDVVPAGEGWLYTAPFEPIVKDGYAIGRGVEDDKAGVILSLWIFRYLRERGIRPPRPLAVFLGASEESGMEDIRSFRALGKDPFVCLVPDAGYPVCRGEKGIARFYYDAKDAFEKIISFEGGLAFNVVLGKATVTLPKEKALADAIKAKLGAREDITFKEGEDVLSLTAEGVSAHASTPQDGVNAAYLLCSLLKEMQELPERDRSILENAARLLGQTDGSAADIAGCDGAFTPLTMANGIVSVREGKLSLSFDIRFDTHITAEELEEKLLLCAQKNGFVMRDGHIDAGFLNSCDDAVLSALLEACELFSGERTASYVMGGGTYCRHLKHAYSLGVSVPYIGEAWQMEEGHGDVHQADERISIDSLLEGISLAAEMVMRAAFVK